MLWSIETRAGPLDLELNTSGASVASSCSFGPRDMFPQSCLIRQEIPFSWFELNSNKRKEHRSFDEQQQYKQLATVSYSIDTHCSSSQQFMLLSDQANVELISSDISSKLQSIELHSYRNEHITLLSPSNLSFTSNSMNALLIRYNRDTRQQQETAEILPYSSPATHTKPILYAQTKDPPPLWSIIPLPYR
uniref:Uncharacterized protein n=1 Tax=Ditylenchus dipsaci TaxID=166011 RepID=A0A915EE92_9BILA